MFSDMKKKEYMEFEHSDIFQVKLVTKNILLGPWGPNAKLFLQCDVSFWRNINFLKKLLELSVSLVKQYISLIYVKEKSLCLVNSGFPFVGPQGPILYSKAAKIFHAYED